MFKHLMAFILVALPSVSQATQDRYAEILDINMKGTLIAPFKGFHLHISLNPKDKSIEILNLAIDGRTAKISIPKKYSAGGIQLSTLRITHSPLHAPDAEEKGIVGIGPAYLSVTYQFYSADLCDSKVGEITISTRMDTLENEVEGECVKSPNV